MIQLSMEYDPAPPFDGGSPENEDPEIVAALSKRLEKFAAERWDVARRAAAKFSSEAGAG